MLEDTVRDYTHYLKVDVSTELKCVQDVIDNMLTRLEELSSVMQMIKIKNSECAFSVSEDINKYRQEVTTLSKKINILSEVVVKVHDNVDALEKQVEKAELDFGVNNNNNKIKNFLMPFLKKAQVSTVPEANTISHCAFKLETVMDHFNSSV